VSGRQTVVAPAIAQVLAALETYDEAATIAQRFANSRVGTEIVSQLLAQDVLVAKGSETDRLDAAIDARWIWGHDARYFHYSTRRTAFERDLKREAHELARLARREPPPPPFQDRGGEQIPLPGEWADQTGDFWDVLHARRTRRSFSGEAITLVELAAILRWTWGASQTLCDSALGDYVLKTSPSGGARHPIEVYAVLLRVDQIPAGVYHYSVERDALEGFGPPLAEDAVVELLAHQPWVAKSAVVFLMTALLPRTMWKYRHSHAYRVVHLDAGHVGQTFQLVCTKLGLAPFTSAALDVRAVERVLGLDGVTEVPLYAAAVGRPNETPRPSRVS
jgi:SagB-type dehydrogenase family enzyme